MMEIDRKLNLVIPLMRNDQVLYVHSTPVTHETFRHFFRVMSKAFAQMHKDNLQFLGGPRVMGMMLEDIARSTPRDNDATRSWWEGEDGVEQMLIPEIRRLANVLLPGSGGWRSVPYDDCIQSRGEPPQKALLSEEEIEEVEGAITFFTVSSLMHSRVMRNAMLEGAASMYGLQTTLSNSTEFMNSLKTSTLDENTGEKLPVLAADPSFVPH